MTLEVGALRVPGVTYEQKMTPHLLPLLLCGLLSLAGCKHKEADPAAEGPQNLPIVKQSPDQVHVDNAGRFPLVYASQEDVVSKLNVTGSVSPDISRELPVLSLANGRVVALYVGLGDTVRKGQPVMQVQSPDVANAFSTYIQAVSNEHLAKVTLDRDALLYGRGAIAKTQLEAAQNGEEITRAALTAGEQQLKIYGVDKNHPSDTVKVYSPANGVVVSQNVTASAAAGITYAGNTGSLTIADLSHVWVVVDVYENDLAQVRLGQHVDIHLAAYPAKSFDGTISDIGATLDPSLRTAKLRIVVKNPNNELRLGMFATGIIFGAKTANAIAVPATAVLHLHDVTYVFVPTGQEGEYRRVQVKAGGMLPGNMVQIDAGLPAGQQIVGNALDLENTADSA